MKSSIIIISVTLLLVGGLLSMSPSFVDSSQEQFKLFKMKYGKQYQSEMEHEYRSNVYKINMAKAIEYNNAHGVEIMGETQFMDLTEEEFKSIYLTLKPDFDVIDSRISLKPKEDIEFIDWRDQQVVTFMKNQGSCGSCWAFSSIGLLESFYGIHTGELPYLSEQQLVDCSRLMDRNYGCDGGDTGRALNYIKRNGVTTEEEYPYIAIRNQCQKKGGNYRVKGHVALEKSDDTLVAALQQGPVSVSLDASKWMMYAPTIAPVLYDCVKEEINHAVLAIGYTKNYYIIKNSWGMGWGIAGYIYLGKNNNECGITEHAFIIEQ